MPKVPSNVLPFAPARPQVDPTALAMAAAMTIEEGRIKVAETTKMPWDKLSKEEQNQLLSSSKTLEEGPELNKYDESLMEHGSVILPSKKVFGPKEWQDKLFPSDVERYDLPDGRVILRRANQKAPLVS